MRPPHMPTPHGRKEIVQSWQLSMLLKSVTMFFATPPMSASQSAFPATVISCATSPVSSSAHHGGPRQHVAEVCAIEMALDIARAAKTMESVHSSDEEHHHLLVGWVRQTRCRSKWLRMLLPTRVTLSQREPHKPSTSPNVTTTAHLGRSISTLPSEELDVMSFARHQ